MDKHLFIAGLPKCGTTALAAWLVKNGVAEYLVPSVKEPYIYARSDFGRFAIPNGSGQDIWRLDASVGYAFNPFAIRNMPEHFTKIIICVRNPWERLWSSYKMLKLLALENKEWAVIGESDFPDLKISKKNDIGRHQRLMQGGKVNQKMIDYYNGLEKKRLLDGDFLSRLQHELSYFYLRGEFPFFSVFGGARYGLALRNLIGKYPSENIMCISMPRLDNDDLRQRFLMEFLDSDVIGGRIDHKLVGRDLSIDEAKPDFSRSEFDGVRQCLTYDVQDFKNQIERNNISRDFIDFKELLCNIY
ncbi:sulfotransferase domain-containing protein [Comamonas aquatica]|uniref:sulfotransferase domain-containing protein n=1 Tax=Comamonas aquatica TaxID=225991 RepID=UPI002447A1EC|nr:sulfotransferase domain-containing protein [Comamonas aquatica]MDH1674376.1 hypothetical protein [Comamonas aquatica]MDH1677928.1 hypothetical protein [Comamonas aquatica]